MSQSQDEKPEKPKCDLCGEDVSLRTGCQGCKLLHEVKLAQDEMKDARLQSEKFRKRYLASSSLAMKKQTEFAVLMEQTRKERAARLADVRDPNRPLAVKGAGEKLDIASVVVSAPPKPPPQQHGQGQKVSR